MTKKKLFSAFILTATLAGTTLSGCTDANDNARQQASPDRPGQQVSVPAKTAVKTGVKTMKIRLKLQNTTLKATLDDNATARDFAALLPLTLTLKDYAETEKISDLPKKLSTEGAPASIAPVAGDITFYAPWGNLALFYKDGQDSRGLVKLGKIDSGIETLKRPGPLKVTIERIENLEP